MCHIREADLCIPVQNVLSDTLMSSYCRATEGWGTAKFENSLVLVEEDYKEDNYYLRDAMTRYNAQGHL